MTLTARPPRAVSLYLTFQPAAACPMALTSDLGALAAVLRASGEFLGRIDLTGVSLAFFVSLRAMPSELNVLASCSGAVVVQQVPFARSLARCVERLLHWHRTPVDCGDEHREGPDGRRDGAVRWGIQGR
jgi:hypothetical protein